MPNRISVSSADFIRNIGLWQSEALRHPISITHHGRERLVLAAPDMFHNAKAVNHDELHEALAQSRSLNTTVLDQAAEGYLRFDEHLKIVSVNRVVDETLGRAREDLLGATLHDVFPSMAGSVWQSHLQRVLRTRQPENFECKLNQVHVRVRAFPLLEGVGAVFHNVTEEVRLREISETGDAQTAAIMEIDLLSSVHVNNDGRIGYADEAFCVRSGFTNLELTGHRFSDLCVPGRRREFNVSLERVLRDADRVHLRIALIAKEGREIAATLALTPIMTDLVVRGAYALVVCNVPEREVASAA
jgi:PAS domain S-box-containing protein